MIEVNVGSEQETVDYIKYYTESFFIRLNIENLEKLKEKFNKMTSEQQKVFAREFVTSKIRKMPDIGVNGEDFDNSTLAFMKVLFGEVKTSQKTLK